MSTVTTTLNTSNHLFNDYDTSKLLLGDNTDRVVTYTNSTGAAVTLVEGRLMGTVSATGKVLPLAAAAVDGSQFPTGVVINERTVANGATVTLSICTGGKVAREKVVFTGAETFTTVVSGRILEDRIGADTIGIVLVASDELTKVDNS